MFLSDKHYKIQIKLKWGDFKFFKRNVFYLDFNFCYIMRERMQNY